MRESPTTQANESGVALIELAVVVGLFVMLILGGFEFSAALRKHEAASALSRQVAASGFRECSAESDDQVLAACLQGVIDRMTAFIGRSLPGTQIVLHSYRNDVPTSTCPATFSASALVSNGSLPSRVVVQDNTHQRTARVSIDSGTVCDNGVLIVAEVFVPYENGLFGIARWIADNEQVFYNVTAI